MNRWQARVFWVSLLASALGLGGCGGGGGSSTPTPVGNNVVASWSLDGTVQAVVGGNQAISVSFATDDGKPVTAFQVTQNLTALPAGWTASNAPLSCAQVTTGNGCVLLLRYAPTAVTSGTLSIAYSYTDSAAKARTGSATIAYAATSHNNVVTTIVPVGQIITTVGGAQTVSIQFTTDDGALATGLQVTSGLSSLPAGWSSSAATFACASVSSGNGCLLILTYAPSAAGSGMLQLGYSFKDNTGTAGSGSITLSYVASVDNHVVGTVAPAGQVAAIVGGSSETVNVTFTTDNGKPATALKITGGLGSLPTDWTGPATYSCSSVSTGSGCQLALNFMPTSSASGTLLLSYQYTSTAGAAMTGSVAIPYAATSDNNVVATVAPTGQINALAPSGTVNVAVTFTTDDANQASNLSIVSGLSPLPAGWTGPTAFTCAGFATGNGCQLNLTYAPAAAGSGTLVLNYAYTSNSGVAKTATVSLPYQATTHNNLVATPSPSGQVTAVLNQGTQVVNLTFTTDDGNPVSAVNITSGLSILPADWTGPPTFSCASVSTGTGCVLTLSFRPTSKSSGTVSLGYAYTDNAGASQTGTINLPYASIPTYFYANELSNTVLRCAASFVDGSLSGCGAVATGFKTPYGLAFNGNHVYIADRGDTVNSIPGAVNVCPVNADGTFGTCVAAAAPGTFTAPNAIAASSGYFYVADSDGSHSIQVCTISATDGTLSNCTITAGTLTTPLDVPDGIAIVSTVAYSRAYIVDYNGGNLTTCNVSALDGTLAGCTQQAIGATPAGLAYYNGNLYVGTGDAVTDIKLCALLADGSVPACVAGDPDGTAAFSQAVGFGFVNGFAYVSGYGGASGTAGGIAYCPLNADGSFSSCKRGTDKAIKGVNFFGMAAH